MAISIVIGMFKSLQFLSYMVLIMKSRLLPGLEVSSLYIAQGKKKAGIRE